MDIDINGLVACPNCGELGRVRLQTPPDDDGIVRRAYFLCFGCHGVSPDCPEWNPCHWHNSGSALFRPLRDFYNSWASKETAQR